MLFLTNNNCYNTIANTCIEKIYIPVIYHNSKFFINPFKNLGVYCFPYRRVDGEQARAA